MTRTTSIGCWGCSRYDPPSAGRPPPGDPPGGDTVIDRSQMNLPQQTATPPAPAASAPLEQGIAPGAARWRRLLAARARPQHLALAGVLALSAVLNTHRLPPNGSPHIFYSGSVKSRRGPLP